MGRIPSRFVLWLLAVLLVAGEALAGGEAGDDRDWPTVQHDMLRTGWTPAAPDPPYAIRWVWTNGERLDPGVVAAAEGKLKRGDPHALFFDAFPPVVLARFMNHAQPMVVGGVAYIASVSASTRDSAGPGELFAIDVKTGLTKWRSPTSGPAMHCVTLADGSIFVATARGLDAFDLAGRKRWGFREPRRGNFRGCPAVAGGLVLAGSTSGHFYGVAAADGKGRWEYDAGGPIYQVPAAHDGCVYFGSEGNMHFHCLETATGRLKWKSTAVQGRTYWHYWPVIAPKAGVVMFQTHALGGQHASGMDVVAKAPNDYHKAQDALREYLQANPQQRSFYVLDLADGRQRLATGTGQAGFSADLMPPPIVRTDGGREIVYSYHYAQQGTFQEGGKFHGYSHPADFGMLDFRTGYFERTGPVGSNAAPVICRFDDFHQTTMGGAFLFGLQNVRQFGCTEIGPEGKPMRWSVGFQRPLWEGYERRDLDGLIGDWREHNFHWGGTTCATLLPDAVLVLPFGGLYIVCYESRQS